MSTTSTFQRTFHHLVATTNLLNDGSIPQSEEPISLAVLVLTDEDCQTLRGANMLLYDNGCDQQRVIILATNDNVNVLGESSS